MWHVKKLLGELHARSIWQVLGSYAVGAWLVLQLAETLSSLLGLPLWFGPAVIGLLIAGLPLVILTSVVQGGRPAPAEPGEAAEATGTQKFFTWRNALMAAGGVVLLFVLSTGSYLGLRQLGVGPFGTLQAKGLIDPEARVILAEFDNRSSDPTIGETVRALFAIDLAQSTAINLLERPQIAPVLERMERPADTPLTLDVAMEVAQREGIKAIMAGEVLPLGEGFVISTRLMAVPDGGSLIAERATANGVAEIPKAVDLLSARLRERIGESLRTIQGDPPLEDVTTGSLEALRKYAQAVQANDAGDYQRAISLLDEALAADSTFAMAHRKLGIILNNGNLEPERSRAAFTRAWERRDRLTERERYLAEAAYHHYVAGDQQASIDAYRSLLERYPNDGVALNNLGIQLEGIGRLEEAEGLYRRAIEQRTANPSTYGNAMFLQSRLGMDDRAKATYQAFAEAFPGQPLVLRNGSGLTSSRFDHDEAERIATRLRDAVRGNPVWESVAMFELGNLALVRGRVREGREELLLGFRISEDAGLGFVDMPGRLFEWLVDAQMAEAFLGDSARVLETLDRATRDDVWTATPPPGRSHLAFATLYAAVGAPEPARALLAAYESEVGPVEDADPRSRVLHALATGEIAIAEGRYEDAVRQLRPVEESWVECPLCGVRELGKALALSGQPDSAIAVYERYLDARLLFRLNTDALNLWRTFVALGELYEDRGDRERAIEMYTRFADLWEDADPELQPRVRDARQAIDRLRGVGGGSGAG